MSHVQALEAGRPRQFWCSAATQVTFIMNNRNKPSGAWSALAATMHSELLPFRKYVDNIMGVGKDFYRGGKATAANFILPTWN